MSRPTIQSAPELFTIGQQLAQAGRRSDARAAYRQSAARDPRFLPAHFALGQLASFERDYAGARQSLGTALRLAGRDERDLRVVAPALAAILSLFQPASYDAVLDDQLQRCFGVAEVDAQTLARVTARLLLLKYPDAARDAEAIGRDPLWIALLTQCINTWPPMEERLGAARRRLLLDHVDRATVPHTVTRSACVLALQAFAGEYVWHVTTAEADHLARPVAPVLAAMYQPLATLDPVADLRALKRDKLSGLLVKRSYTDARDEAALAAGLARVGGADQTAVSAKVRAQYEEHPYPRWRAPPTPRPIDLRAMVAALPGVDAARLPADPWRVLIAGCGTGYEAVGVARTNPRLDIVAIDLSGASLAYCARMMDELGVGNVALRQGDILDLAELGQQFDLAYSTGVLHHMERPEDGLASICRVLSPGGIVRIALYSERARQPIRAAHALIRARGWTANATDIRAFRAHIFGLPEQDPLASLRESDDFYSLSGCRDLVFHVQEHRYSLPGVAALLRGAGLALIGFDTPPDILALFRTSFGVQADVLDLGLWDALEGRHPSLFVEMFALWCQKAA